MFIYSIPIFFSHVQLGTPFELILIILSILICLYFTMPHILPFEDKVNIRKSGLTFYKYLLEAWTGQLQLWFVFWPFFILLNVVLFSIDTLAQQGKFTVSSWDEIHFILATPVICWTIAVWRNSVNTGLRFWGAAARLMTVVVFFEYGVKLIIRRDYPRIFFACKEIMLDYSGCF